MARGGDDAIGADSWLPRSLIWIADRLDTLAALVAGVAAVAAGAFGLAKGDTLTTATLGVLTVVAFSLVRERTSRLNLADRLKSVSNDIQRTQDAISSIESGAPYHLILHENAWDLSADGSATATRIKKLRFAQNEVVAIADWWQGDGEQTQVQYTPGKSVHDYGHNGRRYQLIALDRVYVRGEELAFKVERDLKGVFPNSPDRAGVITLDRTMVLRIIVRWPTDRPPKNVRLRRLDAAQNVKSTEIVTSALRSEDGRQILLHRGAGARTRWPHGR